MQPGGADTFSVLFVRSYGSPQSSPHFVRAKRLLNSLACETANAKALMSGASRLGQGTRVTIRLPVDCETACRGAQPWTTACRAALAPEALSECRVKLSA